MEPEPQTAAGSARGRLDPESRAWVGSLRGGGSERARALERLHELLLRAAHAEAARHRRLHPEIAGAELDDLCHQAADDALVAVTGKLDSYRGASRFTTWAYGFAVFEVSVKLNRHAWRGRAVPTADDDVTWERAAESAGRAHAALESAELLRALRHAIADELTPRQREVFVAAALNDVPIDALAERLESNRGAIYKVLHDARRKLRARLERDGHLEAEEGV